MAAPFFCACSPPFFCARFPRFLTAGNTGRANSVRRADSQAGECRCPRCR
jgi:hypothetical protein